MNPERDAAAVVRAWLRDDPPENADRVLDAVLAELDATPQRRPRWLGGNFPTMKPGWLGYGVAAVSLAVGAMLGLSLLSHRVAAPPTQTPAPTPFATPLASPPPRLQDGMVGGRRYTLAGARGITVQAPARGWSGYCCPGDPAIFNDAELAEFASFRYADATGITLYDDPCHWSQSEIQQPGGAAAIAAAMSSLPNRSGTEPETVSLAGKTAVHVRLTVPDDATFEKCYGREYRTWNSLTGDPRTQDGAGEVDDIYLVDIGESTILFDLSYFPDTSKADRRALEAMLQSIQIR